jgi:spermidine/putrescine transport system permease protein
MAAGDDDKGQRKGRFAPYGLLSPGILWLVLFFLVPMWTLLRIALSHKPNPYLPTYVFDWRWSNFSDAVDRFQPELLRSFEYAAIATVLCIVIGYPLAYYIAVKGGRWKNLLLGLVIVPFFTSFLIRTIAWQTILGSNGFIVTSIHDLHLTGFTDAVGITTHGAILNTPQAVVGGLTYNFIPFMILPIYVSLEKIDPALLEAARDLYSTPARAFWRVVLPLSLPGVFAGTLLTFIPAAGDFINAELLGNTNTRMIGTTVSQLFLAESDYPTAAALSFIFMAIITVAVLVYARVLGTDELSS